MTKITLSTVSELQAFPSAAANINSNSATLTTAIDNTLSRDGTNPNTMNANLDMNSNRILNLPTPASSLEPARLVDLETLTGSGTITINPLPTGGTTGQVLEKNSNANFDAGWFTLPNPSIVNSIDGRVGVFTTGNGVQTTAGNVIQLTPAVSTLPTHQVFLTGSGTYITPANCKYIRVRLVGAGGGSGGSGTAGSGGTGGAGGNTTFGTALFTANGGGGGVNGAGTAVGGTGGTATGGIINLPGTSGQTVVAPGVAMTLLGGGGGGSAFFGGGTYGGLTTGLAPSNNTGGGAGGGGTTAGVCPGSGGGGGGSCEGWILSPVATYPYAVGTAGTQGAAGTSGNAGNVGSAGIIIVDEFYGS